MATPSADVSNISKQPATSKRKPVRKWTPEEDELMISLVKEYGTRHWGLIGSKLSGRTGKQCRERWHNQLDPSISKHGWTPEEESILIKAHAELGNKWAEIAKYLPGRTDNTIKNHWNSSKRRIMRMESTAPTFPDNGIQEMVHDSEDIFGRFSDKKVEKLDSTPVSIARPVVLSRKTPSPGTLITDTQKTPRSIKSHKAAKLPPCSRNSKESRNGWISPINLPLSFNLPVKIEEAPVEDREAADTLISMADTGTSNFIGKKRDSCNLLVKSELEYSVPYSSYPNKKPTMTTAMNHSSSFPSNPSGSTVLPSKESCIESSHISVPPPADIPSVKHTLRLLADTAIEYCPTRSTPTQSTIKGNRRTGSIKSSPITGCTQFTTISSSTSFDMQF